MRNPEFKLPPYSETCTLNSETFTPIRTQMSRGSDRGLANNGNPFYFRPPWDDTNSEPQYTSESPRDYSRSNAFRVFSVPPSHFSDTTRSPSPAATNRRVRFSPQPTRFGSESYPSTAVTSESLSTQQSMSPSPMRISGMFGLPNPFASESEIPRSNSLLAPNASSQPPPTQWPMLPENYNVRQALNNQRQWLEEDRNMHRNAANGLEFMTTDWNVNGRPPGFEQMYRAAADAATNHPDYNEILAQQLAAASAYTPTFNTPWPPFSAFNQNNGNDRN